MHGKCPPAKTPEQDQRRSHDAKQPPRSPEIPRRAQLQRLIAEAARSDWNSFHGALPFSVITSSPSMPHVGAGCPEALPTAASTSSPTSARRTSAPSPHVMVVTAQKREKIIRSLQTFHRTYWQQVMKDATDVFDAVVERASLPTSPTDPCPDHGSELPSSLVMDWRAVEDAAYQNALSRLSRRRMWCSPVASCLERRNFGDFIKENEAALTNPMKIIWQQQAAQRSLLNSLPEGSLFAEAVCQIIVS